MDKVPLLKMNNGLEIPAIGFGTWRVKDGSEAVDAVTQAIKDGYRLIDTARIYGNERSVGKAIAGSGTDRKDLFITTKLWNDDQGYESGLAAFDESMEKLGLDYLDLYLIHWPGGRDRKGAWKALTKLYKDGRTKSIGVSNYMINHLEELLSESDIVPAVNQVEFHPFLYSQLAPLLDYCAKKGIIVEAYSPLAQGHKVDDPTIVKIAQTHGKSGAQVMLRWAIQHNTLPIPKSVTPSRIKENLEVFDFELSNRDMDTLNALGNADGRQGWDPTSID